MTPEQRFQERALKIRKLINEADKVLNNFTEKLDMFSNTLIRFEDTKTALLTGSGELELF